MFLPKLTTDLFSTNGFTTPLSVQILYQNRPFPSFPGLCFKTRVGAQPLIWKSFFILMQIKLIFTRKVVHPVSFWRLGFLELGSGLLIFRFQKSSRLHVSFSLFSPVHMYSFSNRNGYWPQIILKDLSLFLWTQLFDQKVCFNKQFFRFLV